MDRDRFSHVAHAGLLLWNPLPEAQTLALADSLPLSPDQRVLDVGCGRAALLIRVLERTGARGVGVDRAPEPLALARADAAGRIDPARLELRAEPFDPARFGVGAFELALCIGATHAAGGLRGALRALRSLLVPGGAALIGEGHWLRDPDPEYLAFLGSTPDELLDLDGTRATALGEGFRVERSLVTSPEDFDRYEDRYAGNVEAFCARHPEDPDRDAFLRRIRAWRAAYVRWGRDTLGFALHLLRRAPD